MSETTLVIIFGSLASVLTLVDIFLAYLHYKLATSKLMRSEGRCLGLPVARKIGGVAAGSCSKYVDVIC